MARPRIGDTPLSAAERQRRRRERRKAANRDAERSHETAQAAELERLKAELAKRDAASRHETTKRDAADRHETAQANKQDGSGEYWKRRYKAEVKRREKVESDLSHLQKQKSYAVHAASLESRLKQQIPVDIWKWLAQLTHPDKHGGSDKANAAMVWLNENKPRKSRKDEDEM